MTQHTDMYLVKKVLEALELCVHPVTREQIETLAGCRDLGEILEYLVDDKQITTLVASVVATNGQSKDEVRYQIAPL